MQYIRQTHKTRQKQFGFNLTDVTNNTIIQGDEKDIFVLFDDICIGTDGMRRKIRTATIPWFSTQLSCILIARGYGEIGRRTGFRFQRGNP